MTGFILAGVMLQGVISVASDNFLGSWALLGKSWKEILLGVIALLLTFEVNRLRRWNIYNTLVMKLVAAFALLHILSLAVFHNGTLPMLAGLLIDLRFMAIFVLVYTLVRLYPAARRTLLGSLAIGFGIVIVFGLMQIFVLPPDFLAAFGYSKATIAPYLTVDENQSFIRISSTLRGPNPVGALALITLTLIVSFCAQGIRTSGVVARRLVVGVLVSLATCIVAWHSYSRSALLGIIVTLVVVGAYYGYRQFGNKVVGYGAAALALLGLAGAALYVSPYGSIILAHEDPLEGNNVNSNDGHAASLAEGWDRFIHEPFGYGVGSVGSPSLLGDSPLIIESQYFYIAHETGWLGLGLFLALCVVLVRELWRRRADWLAVAVLASGIGLSIVGVVLPVWADDTIALVWWGLAGIALASGYNKSHARTLN